jgi:hypothetical protein
MKYITRENEYWSGQILSSQIGKKFVKPNVLVVCQTWLPKIEIIDEVTDWLKLDENNKVVLISLFDPCPWEFLSTELDLQRIQHITCNEVCFFVIAVDKLFLKYTVEDVTPENFTNNFLCYQRKVFDYRKLLFVNLINKKGIVTLGDREFKEINKDLPNHTGYTEVGGIGGDGIPIPNDIWSLGNLQIWNTSFLNIISETPQDLNNSKVFLSEKTFKPIVGLRPFLHAGHPKSSALLERLGFATFDEDFGYKPTNDYIQNTKQIVEIIDKLEYTDKLNLFNKLLPKVLHNKNQLHTIALNEWDKINKLVNES